MRTILLAELNHDIDAGFRQDSINNIQQVYSLMGMPRNVIGAHLPRYTPRPEDNKTFYGEIHAHYLAKEQEKQMVAMGAMRKSRQSETHSQFTEHTDRYSPDSHSKYDHGDRLRYSSEDNRHAQRARKGREDKVRKNTYEGTQLNSKRVKRNEFDQARELFNNY